MRTPTQILPKDAIELTARGVYLTTTTSSGDVSRNKIAKRIRVRAVGKRDSDGGTYAQLRFRTIHGDTRTEFVDFADLLPANWQHIRNRLANLGYQWPKDESLASAILNEIATIHPKRKFRMVSAPGWYELVFVIPGQVFAHGDEKTEIYFDPETDAHLGAFVVGKDRSRIGSSWLPNQAANPLAYGCQSRRRLLRRS